MVALTRHDLPESLRAAKQRALERLLAGPRRARPRVVHRVSTHPDHNMVGVGIGRKIVKGRATSRPSVRLYVAQKLDRRLVAPDHLLPPEIAGVETDVVQVGRLRAQVLPSRQRRRPARPGCSIGFRLGPPNDGLLMAGTLGAVVAQGPQQFILSNNHVLANENALGPGTTIYQPGLLDHGDPDADGVARLSRFITLSTAGPNRTDCALAEILDPALVGPRVMAKVGKLKSAEPFVMTEGLAVEKVGRGSGYTVGEVFDIDATLTLNYEIGDLTFVNQALIRGASGAFSEYGDSGALVVAEDSGRAVGLLIGGSADFSVANHLDDVLTDLGVTLVV
jgi:hypothetical protein